MRNKPLNKEVKANRKQKGQFVIEALLIMFLFMGMATVLMSNLRDRQLLGRLVSGPWERVAGMMGSGHWEPVGTARAAGRLPHQRTTTRKGDN